MKKFILVFACLVTMLSCKKEASDNITAYNWVLTSAKVNPAITIGNITSTDLNVVFKNGCYTNLTYTFLKDGTFTAGSNGALCDMATSSSKQTWVKNGSIITFSGDYGEETMTIDNNVMTGTGTIIIAGTTYITTLIFTAVKK